MGVGIYAIIGVATRNDTCPNGQIAEGHEASVLLSPHRAVVSCAANRLLSQDLAPIRSTPLDFPGRRAAPHASCQRGLDSPGL